MTAAPTGTTNRCARHHDGAHMLFWNLSCDGEIETVREVVEHAARHADVSPATMIVFDTVLLRARTRQETRHVFVSDAELAAVTKVVEDAVDYMLTNRYADDEDVHGQDARTARLLGDGAIALICWRDVENAR